MKWQPELITNGLKFMCMKRANLTFLHSVLFLPFSLCKLPEALGITVTKPWYTHHFNTKGNFDYVAKFQTSRIKMWR